MQTTLAGIEPLVSVAQKPLLKWPGGKRWLVPRLRSLWEGREHQRLVEPFCGAMAVTLGLQPSFTLTNDVNAHLINFYSWVQKGLTVQIPMRNDETLYYEHRARFNELIEMGKAETKEAAELFFFLNRTGYNGLCRFNSRGLFNVPFGRYKTINYPTDFVSAARGLARYQFNNADFEQLEKCWDDFVYADPPYDVQFTNYSTDGFGWADQVRLADWLTTHPGQVIVSNQATQRVLELYKERGFEIEVLDAPRMISCTGDRAPAKEMLAIKGF